MTRGAQREPRLLEDDDKVLALSARRREVFRLSPPRPLTSASEAMRFLRDRRIVMATGRSSLATMAQAIAGREVRGSWMADPSCHAVYDMLTQILSRAGVHELPLVQGKSVIFTNGLGAAIERVASDPDRRAAARLALSPSAAWLLGEVESAGELRMDSVPLPAKEGRTARTVLERELLVVGESLHTDRGYHTAVLRPWDSSPLAQRFSSKVDSLSLEKAQRALLEACLHSAIVAPEQEVLKWLAFAPQVVEDLVATGKVTRLRREELADVDCDASGLSALDASSRPSVRRRTETPIRNSPEKL